MSARDIGLALVVAVMWGVNFVVMKHAVSEVPPFALTGIRFTLCALPAILFLPRPKVSWRTLLLFGLVFGVVKFGLLFTAFRLGMPSGLAALVLQLQAALSIALAYVWFRERPSPLQWVGIAVALAGATVVMSGMPRAEVLPVALTLAAAMAWAVANMATKMATVETPGIDPLAWAAWSSLAPGLVMLALSLVIEGPGAGIGAATRASVTGFAAMAYLCWPIGLFSGALWVRLLGRYPTASVTPFALLVPVIGLVCGWIVYGETLSGATTIGALLIVTGLLITVLGGRIAALIAGRPLVLDVVRSCFSPRTRREKKDG